jgi:hypothetical protein
MKKTKDCVVIYHNGHGGERQCTVITSPRGSLAGKDRARPRRRMFSLLQEN